MPSILKDIFDNLHNFASVAASVVSVIGVIAAGSTKLLADYTTRKMKDKIAAETNKYLGSTAAAANDDKEAITNTGTVAVTLGRHRTIDTAYAPPKESGADITKRQIRTRLGEIVEERERQRNVTKWSRRTSNLLTFGQYIIGAVLTSSFIQQSLSPIWISIFGLLVIVCSATKQHFHTDENAQTADYRSRRLASLARYAQDQIAILEAKSVNGEDRTDALISLLNELTHGLSQIENPEASLPQKKRLGKRRAGV
jgi:hypothetical protein